METINYQSKANALLGYLSDQNYSDRYVRVFRKECERLVDYLSVFGTFEGYLEGYSERFGIKLLSSNRKTILLIWNYFEKGHIPSHQHPLKNKANCYEKLSEVSRRHVDSYIASCGSEWATSTKYSTRLAISAFLFHFQQSDIAISDITEDAVWSYFYDSEKGAVLHGHHPSRVVRNFLCWAGNMPGCEYYTYILPMVPTMKRYRKVFDCLTEDEDTRLIRYVLSDECRLSLRDKAVFIVARFCGLRACDISALCISDIDLLNNRLSIMQRKTGVPLIQSLRPIVGNAICRYVQLERPMSDYPNLFLVDGREVRPLLPTAVSDVCDRIYRLAKVREDGHRKGSHILRHRFAQSLIDSGACDTVAMRLLGHSSPSSLGVYLESDQKKLRECALCISDFVLLKKELL